MKQYHYVYLIINKINLNFYIGKHSTDNIDDGYLGSGSKIKNQIEMYGRENFEKVILSYCEDEKEASLKEEQYILIAKSWDNGQFLNLRNGCISRQLEGIKAMPVNAEGKKYSKKTGRVTGRPVTREFPKDWDKTYKLYKEGTLKAKQVQAMYNIPKSTFYYMIKQYEGNL